MLQATLNQVRTMSPRIAQILRTGRASELKASAPYTETNAWLKNFSDDELDKNYEMNMEYVWSNTKEGAQDTAETLLIAQEFGDAHFEILKEKLLDVEEEIGQEYEMVYNDAMRDAMGPAPKEAGEFGDDPDKWELSRHLDDEIWEQVMEELKIEHIEDLVGQILDKDTFYGDQGLEIDLTQRRSDVAKATMKRADAGEDMSYAADNLVDMANAFADDMVEKLNEHLRSGQTVDNRFSDNAQKNHAQFIKDWTEKAQAMAREIGIVSEEEDEPLPGEEPGEQGQPPLPGMENVAAADVIIRTAQDFGDENYEPQLHDHTYLGQGDDEHYFAEDDGSVISGTLIASDDMREKTIEYWESFFEGEPEQIADMMDRGFLGEVKSTLIEQWVDDEDYSEQTVYYSEEADEEHENRDDVVQGIKDWFEGDFQDPKEYEAAVASAIEAIEEKSKYHSEVFNETFDSEEEMRDKFRDMYTDNFKDYAGGNALSIYAREAAEEVVDVDGEGHGLDVKELDDGNFISLGSWQGITADPADLPEQVGKNLKALLHGAKPEYRMEPLEEEGTPS